MGLVIKVNFLKSFRILFWANQWVKWKNGGCRKRCGGCCVFSKRIISFIHSKEWAANRFSSCSVPSKLNFFPQNKWIKHEYWKKKPLNEWGNLPIPWLACSGTDRNSALLEDGIIKVAHRSGPGVSPFQRQVSSFEGYDDGAAWTTHQ